MLDFAYPAPRSIFDRYYSREDTIVLLGDVAEKRILDAGCGYGFYALDLADRGALVTGLDIDPIAVDVAHRRLSGRGDFHVADLSKPLDTVATHSMDLVLASLVLHYLEDWTVPLAEFHRVLVPGGKVVISVHHPFSDLIESGGENYWAPEPWSSGGGGEVYWRRALQDVFGPVQAAGLRVTELSEPRTETELTEPGLTGIPRLLVVAATKEVAG